MRTLVDLPDGDVEALDRIARTRDASRAKIIRQAVTEFLTRVTPSGDDALSPKQPVSLSPS